MARKRKYTRRKYTRRKPQRNSRGFIPELELEIPTEVRREIFVIFWGALAILTILAIGAQLGMVGDFIQKFLFRTFGWGTFLLPITFIGMALARAFSKELRFGGVRNLGIIMILWAFLGILHLFGTDLANGEASNLASGGQLGGYLGFAISTVLRRFLGDMGTGVILFALFLSGIPMVFGKSFLHLIGRIFGKSEDEIKITNSKSAKKNGANIVDISKSKLATPLKQAFSIKHGDDPISPHKKAGIVTPIFDPKLDAEWQMPPLSILKENKDKITFDDMELRSSADKIREKLSNFGIDVEMREAHIGPTVIQYTLKPAEHVKLSKIRALADDLTLALAAKSLRIEAPIPGKSLVGIELPSSKRTTVLLREILESSSFADIQSNLRLVLGRDVTGRPMVTDLKEMPHLLIAGQTGAGKSVAINAFLISLLYQNSPNDLKLILVDPKRVELSMYDKIPHLLTPVISDPDKVVHALKWAVAEMTRRLRVLEEDKVRNIEEFNSKHLDSRLPYIVIVIDELADLMMTSGKEVDALVCRLAQLSRAVGIHLIIATQRPSVNVITGTIKANIPSRISFTVMSQIDSRTILDQAGAEKLMGKGDALFFPTGSPAPVRVQSAFLSTKEVEKVINHLKLSGPVQYQTEILEDKHEINVPGFTDTPASKDDPVIEAAIVIIRETRKASASLLQRRCSIGYAKAARILDTLEERGMIGPPNGAKPREVYL